MKHNHSRSCFFGRSLFPTLGFALVLGVKSALLIGEVHAAGWITGGQQPGSTSERTTQNQQPARTGDRSQQSQQPPPLTIPDRGRTRPNEILKFNQTRSDSKWRVETGRDAERTLNSILATHIAEYSTGISQLRRASGIIVHCEGAANDDLGIHSLLTRSQGLINALNIGYRVPGPIRPARCRTINQDAREYLRINAFVAATSLTLDRELMPLGLVGLSLGRMLACGHTEMAYTNYDNFRGIADHNYRIMPERLVLQARRLELEGHEAARFATITPSYDPVFFGRGIEAGITGIAHDISQCSLATPDILQAEFSSHIDMFREAMSR